MGYRAGDADAHPAAAGEWRGIRRWVRGTGCGGGRGAGRAVEGFGVGELDEEGRGRGEEGGGSEWGGRYDWGRDVGRAEGSWDGREFEEVEVVTEVKDVKP